MGTAAPRSHFSPPVLQRPRSCHSRFARCRASHVISQPILEQECMGSSVKGSVHLAHPSALHQTPSVGPAGILRQAHSAHGDGGSGGASSLRRWGSLRRTKGKVESGADWSEESPSVNLTLHSHPVVLFCFVFLKRPPPAPSPAVLTAEPICHRARSSGVINIAREMVLSAPRPFCKNHSVGCSWDENRHAPLGQHVMVSFNFA